jgi:hypothetical protein
MDNEINQIKMTYIQQVKILTQLLNKQINKIKKQKYVNKHNIIKKYIKDYKNMISKLNKKMANDIANIKNHLNFNIIKSNNKYALLVGINYTNTSYELYGCINDASNIKKMLLDKYEFLEENIIILNDFSRQELLPTNNNIIREFTNLLKKANSGDQLMFLYSGHGSYILDKNNDELTENDSVLIPLDAIYNYNKIIIDDQLKNIIDTNLKTDVKLFALLDCCFSGTALDLRFNYLDNKLNTNNVTTNADVTMISGSTDKQTSADAQIIDSSGNKIYGGALTNSFIKVLESNNYSISYSNLIKNIRQILRQENYTQTPQLSSGRYLDINSNFII